MNKTFRLSITTLMLLTVAPLPASADKPEKPKTTPAASETQQIPWLVNCTSVTGKTSCQATQRLVMRKTGKTLLSVSVHIPPKSKTAAMMIQLPYGLFLPNGVTVDVDGKAKKKHPVQTCNEKGCFVGLPVEGALLRTMQSGKLMTVAFQSLDKKSIKVPVTLSGFKEAYAKL